MRHSAWLLLLCSAVLLCAPDHDAVAQSVWTKHPGNPVFSGGGTGTWDQLVLAACVIFNADSNRYEMWYTGYLGGRLNGIGFATSPDGINWTRRLSPVLVPTPGAWDSLVVLAPWVIRTTGQYRMWYTGSATTGVLPSSIGYATSPDGITWTKRPAPVLTPGPQAWESAKVGLCSVVPVAGGYRMFYTGETTTLGLIGRAFSADGIVWQKDTSNNPVLRQGASGAWDGHLFLPAVTVRPGIWYLHYTGAQVYGQVPTRIGYATSVDSGRTWSKFGGNPVIVQGASGSWDASLVESGSVFFTGTEFRMWYHGTRYTPLSSSLGLASARVDGIAEKRDGVPAAFTLGHNYPNPFNPSTSIDFSVVSAGEVTLAVYDLLGREVAVLVNEKLDPGNYTVRFDAGNLASGVYVCRMRALPPGGGGTFVESKKMLLTR